MPPADCGNTARTGWTGLLASAAETVRYRFFLVAGAFPYVLGAAVAYSITNQINWLLLVVGLVGVALVSLGIEAMNEYLDSRIGGDRAFASTRRVRVWWHLPLGLASFALALAVAAFLASFRGWPVLLFALCGGVMALSYLMPPIALSYRGLGETVIAVAYGPGLTLGSFYLQTGRLSWRAALVSLVPAGAMFAMALANEVPDYFGDRLVGKRNLVVRAGPRKGVVLCGVVMAVWFALIAFGLLLGVFPLPLVLCFLLIPVAWQNVRYGLKYCQTPVLYVRVIRTMILIFMMGNTLAILGFVLW